MKGNFLGVRSATKASNSQDIRNFILEYGRLTTKEVALLQAMNTGHPAYRRTLARNILYG